MQKLSQHFNRLNFCLSFKQFHAGNSIPTTHSTVDTRLSNVCSYMKRFLPFQNFHSRNNLCTIWKKTHNTDRIWQKEQQKQKRISRRKKVHNSYRDIKLYSTSDTHEEDVSSFFVQWTTLVNPKWKSVPWVVLGVVCCPQKLHENVYIDSVLIDFNLKIEHHCCELENKVYYSN